MADPITFVTVDRATKLPVAATTNAIMGKVDDELVAPERQARAELVGTVRALITGDADTSNLNALQTQSKESIIAAINEVFGLLDDAGSAVIDDSQATLSSTYSSTKVVALIAALATAIKGSADSSHDSFGEVQQILADLNTAIGNRVTGSALTTALSTKADLVGGKVPADQLPTPSTGGGTYPPTGGVPKSDLASGVRATLDAADSAYQKPSGGITTSDFAPAVTTSLNKADTAVQPAALTSGLATKADASALAAKADASALAAKADASALATKADLVGGLIPSSQIPAIALTAPTVVASRAAMLALTSSQVQPGDVAIDTSTGTTRGTYMLLTADPSQIANWALLVAPTDAVSSVAGRTGIVTLSKSDVGLPNVNDTSDASKPVSTAQQAALDAKANTVATVTFRIQNNDGTYPSIAGVPAGQLILYVGPTAPDPASTRQPCLYLQGTMS